MLDYYQILGISRQASIPEIKKAYKALALKYHPDRNPDNPAAEEKIKQINEAYAILSDPYKKASHDLLLNYRETEQYKQTTTSTSPPKYRRPNIPKDDRSVYDRYGKYVWNERPQYHEAPAYKIDKTYVKNQLISFIAMLILAATIIGAYQFNNYLDEQKEVEITEQNDKVIADARGLFAKGEYRPAIQMVMDLVKKYPIRHRLYEERENMVAGLSSEASNLYQNAAYTDAMLRLEVVRDFERPMKINTWKMIADCYNHMQEYRKAVHAYDYILIREDSNVELMIKVANIYLDHLNMPEKALEYYSQARQTFRQFQVANYGEAFELVMRPQNIPKIYYDMFVKRASLNTELGKYDEAIKDYNWSITLRPDTAENYYLRAMCRYRTNNLNRACLDWNKAVELGDLSSREMISTYCN